MKLGAISMMLASLLSVGASAETLSPLANQWANDLAGRYEVLPQSDRACYPDLSLTSTEFHYENSVSPRLCGDPARGCGDGVYEFNGPAFRFLAVHGVTVPWAEADRAGSADCGDQIRDGIVAAAVTQGQVSYSENEMIYLSRRCLTRQVWSKVRITKLKPDASEIKVEQRWGGDRQTCWLRKK